MSETTIHEPIAHHHTNQERTATEPANSTALAQLEKALASNTITNAEEVASIFESERDSLGTDINSALKKFRTLRQVNKYDREKNILDNTIVVLAHRGQMDLAGALMTPSPKEQEIIQGAIDDTIHDESEAAQINANLGRVFSAKQRQVHETLGANGLTHDEQNRFLALSQDPEAALAIDEDFWDTFQSFPLQAKTMLIHNSDTQQTAQVLQNIYYYGLIDYSSDVFNKLRSIKDPEERTSFLAHLENADKIIPQDARPGKQHIQRDTLIQSLIRNGQINHDYAQSLVTLQRYFNEHKKQTDEHSFKTAADHLASKNNPQKEVEALIKAFEQAQKYIDQNDASIYLIVKQEDPLAFAEAIQATAEIAKSTKKRVRSQNGLMKSLVSRRTIDTQNYTEPIALAELELRKQGLSLLTMDEAEASSFLDKLTTITARDEWITFSKLWDVGKEHSQLLEKRINPAINTGKLEDLDKTVAINVEAMPALISRFKALEINRDLALNMFASWSTYNPYSEHIYDLHLKPNETPTKKQIVDGLAKTKRNLPIHLELQIGSMVAYAEQYGNEELHEVINTFGIYNFARCNSEQLHRQMERWKDGNDLPKNIFVSARTDWNSALRKDQGNYASTFGEQGYYYFEANDATQIAKIAVAVGNRERNNHRDPQITNSVKNFVISAHADPNGLLLGVNGERLNAADYIQVRNGSTEQTNDTQTNTRLNNYRRHLGNQFRLILKGCKTDGEGMNGRNIKTAIGEGHAVRTEGSSDLVQNFIINADDHVVFENTQGETTASSPYIPDQRTAA